ncbi:immunoglobulin superfamily member 1-like isoform X2 [Notamacropus eugenii]|uniref:immunoglobulin superfamily member 1-like isoform X2 n=1 Tax=Notamacropus eugenii TaxID=9315 RepID=UPI003B673898
MDPTSTFLVYIGLYLTWAVRAQMDPIARPTLWAVPSPVVPKGANMTLRCQGHLESDRFQLWKDGELRDDRNEFWQQADFMLKDVDVLRDAGSYSCRTGQGSLWTEFSEALALVVTGALPKPSISVLPGATISAGTTVTIRCQMSPQTPTQDYNFALLEGKSLELLQRQSPGGTRADFLLLSVRPEDTGNYSCIYYKKTVPHRGSHPSQTLELTVFGQLPRPILWAQTSLMMVPGANITLWCSRPKLSFLQEVMFTLWKAGTQEPLQQQTSSYLWISFLLPSLRPEDTGSYSCTYTYRATSTRRSEHSEAVELVVPGSLPKPSLSALPALVVEPGTHVTLQCRQPLHIFLHGVTFSLIKVGTPQALQSQNPVGNSAVFPLLSVRTQDAGNYSCVYHQRMTPYHVSESIEALVIWVTDALPKPSLSAWPQVVSGANMTLLCQGPSWSRSFILYKEGDKKILASMNNTQDGTKFFLTHMTTRHSGSYTCSYQLQNNGSLWTQHSDPLQLIVTGTEPNNTLLITFICVSFLLLLLCLVLLAILCQGSIPVGSLQEESPRRCLCCPFPSLSTCLLSQHETTREEDSHTRVPKERPREPLISVAEDLQGTTYAQLNNRPLNETKSNLMKKSTEPTIYATVPRD